MRMDADDADVDFTDPDFRFSVLREQSAALLEFAAETQEAVRQRRAATASLMALRRQVSEQTKAALRYARRAR